jgi:hypothetical protein
MGVEVIAPLSLIISVTFRPLYPRVWTRFQMKWHLDETQNGSRHVGIWECLLRPGFDFRTFEIVAQFLYRLCDLWFYCLTIMLVKEAVDDLVIGEWWFWNDLGEGVRCLVVILSWYFVLRDWGKQGKTWIGMWGVPTESRTKNVPETNLSIHR